MKGLLKIFIVVGVALMIAGGICLGVGIKNDVFARNIVENSYTIEDDFNNISIDSSISDITIKVVDDDITTINTVEGEKYSFNVSVVDDTLTIEDEHKGKWLDNLTFFSKSYSVAISLNRSTFNNINIKASTGDVRISDLNVDDIKIDLSTGDTKLSSVRCNTLDIDASTGDIKLIDTISSESLKIDVSTGDVVLDRFDSKDIYIKGSTGDVRGTILTDKVFDCHASTGSVKVPTSGETEEKCYIKVSTGDIKISIAQ